ncbi:hypothetical protein DOY81_005388, partial [Sarcophaga bullata]
KEKKKLVSLMEENPQLAKDICSKMQGEKWEEITVKLNCMRPPVRTTTKWIQVWADMKSKTKKKVTENRAEYPEHKTELAIGSSIPSAVLKPEDSSTDRKLFLVN